MACDSKGKATQSEVEAGVWGRKAHSLWNSLGGLQENGSRNSLFQTERLAKFPCGSVASDSPTLWASTTLKASDLEVPLGLLWGTITLNHTSSVQQLGKRDCAIPHCSSGELSGAPALDVDANCPNYPEINVVCSSLLFPGSISIPTLL